MIFLIEENNIDNKCGNAEILILLDFGVGNFKNFHSWFWLLLFEVKIFVKNVILDKMFNRFSF